MIDPASDALREMRNLLKGAGDLEQRIQRAIAGQVSAPFDAVFDLLGESATMMTRQAEALRTAGAALEEAATMMKSQAELFERSLNVARQPLEIAKGAAGVKRPPE